MLKVRKFATALVLGLIMCLALLSTGAFAQHADLVSANSSITTTANSSCGMSFGCGLSGYTHYIGYTHYGLIGSYSMFGGYSGCGCANNAGWLVSYSSAGNFGGFFSGPVAISGFSF